MHDFPAVASGAVAEHQIILRWPIKRGGKAKAHILIVRRVDGVHHIGGVAVEIVGILFVVHKKKVDVAWVIVRLISGRRYKGMIRTAQLRAGGVRRNLKGKI